MDIREVLTAARCPGQNAYAERFIGSLRRECLDLIIVFNESSVRGILKPTSSITDTHGYIWRFRKMRQHPEPFNFLHRVSWSSYRKWAGCIIAMSEGLPESIHRCGLSSLQLNSMRRHVGDPLLLSQAVGRYNPRQGVIRRSPRCIGPCASQSCCPNRVFGNDRWPILVHRICSASISLMNAIVA